jgi:transposase
MDDVVKSYPVRDLHVVLDNLNIHKNEAAKQWLLKPSRVHFHCTPTHASWMNMIECFFSILTRQALTQSVHHSKKDLKDFSSSIPEEIQRESHGIHLDQRAGAAATNHRKKQGIPSDSS